MQHLGETEAQCWVFLAENERAGRGGVSHGAAQIALQETSCHVGMPFCLLYHNGTARLSSFPSKETDLNGSSCSLEHAKAQQRTYMTN